MVVYFFVVLLLIAGHHLDYSFHLTWWLLHDGHHFLPKKIDFTANLITNTLIKYVATHTYQVNKSIFSSLNNTLGACKIYLSTPVNAYIAEH